MKSARRIRSHTKGLFARAGRADEGPRWAFGSFTLVLVAVILVGRESMAGIRGGVANSIIRFTRRGSSPGMYGERRGVDRDGSKILQARRSETT